MQSTKDEIGGRGAEDDAGAPAQGLGFQDILAELDRSETILTVRVESRRWGKPMTVVQGLPGDARFLAEAARSLRRYLATGGTVKDNRIELQGDHRPRIRGALERLGFPRHHIEIR